MGVFMLEGCAGANDAQQSEEMEIDSAISDFTYKAFDDLNRLNSSYADLMQKLENNRGRIDLKKYKRMRWKLLVEFSLKTKGITEKTACHRTEDKLVRAVSRYEKTSFETYADAKKAGNLIWGIISDLSDAGLLPLEDSGVLMERVKAHYAAEAARLRRKVPPG